MTMSEDNHFIFARFFAQTRQVLPGMGNARRLHFGLGTATSGVSIKIYWPDSATPQTLSGDAYVNKILRVSQP